MLIFLSGCSSSYGKGYTAGYSDGYNDARVEFNYDIESIIEEQYYTGYKDGYDRIAESRNAAEYYAMERSVFSPEEAMMIIDSYENGTPFWENGQSASEEDYQNAARTLYYFYEYYFDGEFSYYEFP